MAKAIRFFSVSDSYGRPVEVALSETNVWFFRTYGWNGYGKVWTKWAEYEGPAFETRGENKYTGEIFEYDKPVAYWGFNRMGEYDVIPRVRLPR